MYDPKPSVLCLLVGLCTDLSACSGYLRAIGGIGRRCGPGQGRPYFARFGLYPRGNDHKEGQRLFWRLENENCSGPSLVYFAFDALA